MLMSFLDFGGLDLSSHLIELGLSIFSSSLMLIMTFKIISGTIDLYLDREMNDEAFALINKQRNYTILSLVGILLTTLVPNIINVSFKL